MSRFAFCLAFFPLFVACGDDNANPHDAAVPDATPDAPAIDAAIDAEMADAFETAPHTHMPLASRHNGVVLTAVQLVSITFPNYALRPQVEGFGDYILTSPWFAAVGTEYGVGQGTHIAKVALTQPGGATISDAQIVTLLRQGIMAGTLPSPQQNNQVLYMLYVPPETLPDASLGALYGYHSFDTYNGAEYPYAVVFDCGMGADVVTSTASHELVEACTDPFDVPRAGFYMNRPLPDPWYFDGGDELADLCCPEPLITAGAYTVQRIWSNAAALAGGAPCVPVPANTVYFNVSVDPTTVPQAAAGSMLSFTLTGWSTAPHADWHLGIEGAGVSDFNLSALMPTLDATTINNGRTVTLHLHVPAGAATGQVGAVFVTSGAGPDRRFWPVGFQVQ
jgi:hypothetical protein